VAAKRSTSDVILRAVGSLLFAIGLVGTFVPVLPTTIFWIGAAACFAKSSPRLYQRIITWPVAGPVVENFLNGRTIARRSKVIALIGMASAAVLVTLTPMGTASLVISLTVIAAAAVYVSTRPERPRGSPTGAA